jgi:hypothetical protein
MITPSDCSASDPVDTRSAFCGLHVEADVDFAVGATDVLLPWAEHFGGGWTTQLDSSTADFEEPWQRAEREQELFYNGV